MLKKRIIPCLDIRNGRTVKGVNFEQIRDAGDPVELAARYVAEGADELVFLDITATLEKRPTLLPLVEKVSNEINIPFTVGGGTRTIADARALLRAGADKVAVNSAAVKDPALLSAIAGEFGKQCLVLAIDARWEQDDWYVYVKGGRERTPRKAIDWAREGCALGAGELLLTSMDRDGTRDGFDLELTRSICDAVSVPVIASGGAGAAGHFQDVFAQTSASAALAASVFHYGQIPIPQLKKFLKTNNIPIR